MVKYHTISFQNAFRGLMYCLRTQPNYKIHLSLSLLAIGSGFFLQISHEEFIIVILLIAIGLTIETINTAIEQTTDTVDKKIREDIRIAKDVAAAAMLVFAIGAVVIAGMIYIPRIINLFF